MVPPFSCSQQYAKSFSHVACWVGVAEMYADSLRVVVLMFIQVIGIK
jgi:hypothetical protein